MSYFFTSYIFIILIIISGLDQFLKSPDENDTGYIVEVDLRVPVELHFFSRNSTGSRDPNTIY